VARDDNGAGGTDALLVYKASETGPYLIEASSTQPARTGAYTLSVRVTRMGVQVQR
jgi:hypothetical protein